MSSYALFILEPLLRLHLEVCSSLGRFTVIHASSDEHETGRTRKGPVVFIKIRAQVHQHEKPLLSSMGSNSVFARICLHFSKNVVKEMT